MGFLLAAAAGGLLMLPFLPGLPPPALLAAVAVISLLLWWRWRNRWWLGIALFSCCFSWSAGTAEMALREHIPPAWEGLTLEAEGRVEGLPEPAERQGLRFRLRPEHVLLDGVSTAIKGGGRWQLYTSSPEGLAPGSHCRLLVRLKRPHGVANPGGFDYEAWLLSEGISATGSVKRLSCRPPAAASVGGMRLRLRQDMQQAFPERPAAGVLLALLSGDRALVPDSAWERYVATGIVHLMAISGLHVTLLSVLTVWLLLNLLRLAPRLALRWPLHKPALLGGFTAALGYSLVAGMTIPTQRTLIMLAVAGLAFLLDRRLPSLHILLLTLMAVLLWSPLAVHAVGFWLSFGAVALLIVLGNAWRELPSWRQALQMQFALSLLLLPMTLWFFDRVSWVSPLANLVAVPLVTFGVVPLGLLGLLFWLAGSAGPAQFFWSGAVGLIEVLDALMAQFAAWPAASMMLSLPGFSALLWLSLALVCLLQPLCRSWRLLSPLLLLPLFFPASSLSEGQLRLTVLDVGQGLAVLVETPGYRLLYDTGPPLGMHADAGLRYVLPTLHRQGVYALDHLVLSHDDSDHTGGARSVLSVMPVGAGLGTQVGLSRNSSPPWRSCEAGQRWHRDGWEFAVLYPDAEQRLFADSDNNRSCVLRISRGRATVLLPGDIGRLGELSLLDRHDAAALKSTVLILGHHGSSSSSSAEFLAAVRPELALISAGYRNSFRHPGEQVLARLRSAGIPWRNTAESGALTVLLQEDASVRLQVYREHSARYWQRPRTQEFSVDQAVTSALGGVGVNR